ncbi:MAG: S9 family peptidase [Planctomycetes bacterium]|nr:S9 family peptidase [Planctomycetota bacterium]
MFRILTLVLFLIPSFAVADEPVKKRPITVEDLWKVKRLGPPSISPDGKQVVVEVTTYSMKKNDSTSNLWVLSTDGKKQTQLTNTAGKNSSPKWSPDGNWIAFLSKRGSDAVAQLYVISPAGGEARRVTNMPMAPSGVKWSADNKTLYTVASVWPDTPDDESYRKKEKAQKDNPVKALVIDDAVYRYWDRWIADGKKPTIFAVDVATGKHRDLLAGTGKHLPPLSPSVADFDVSPDGKELCFVADSAKDPGTDTNLDLYTLPLDKKGKPRSITADNTANDTHPVYSPDGKYLAFLRQTIKFFYADRQRLIVMDRESGKSKVYTSKLDRSCSHPQWLPKSLTESKEPWFVVETEDKGRLRFYMCAGQASSPMLLDDFSASGRSMAIARGTTFGDPLFLQSSFNLPPTLFTLAPEGKSGQLSHFNDDLVSRWQLGKVEERYFKGADDEDVHMWIVYPPSFDPKKKWPLVQVVHGGPHNGIMTDFSFRWNLQLWAAQGWVIGCVNFHGSSGFGQKFADSITGDYATKPTIDIMKATDWFEQQPWIDKSRIATAGASYGGFMMAWLNGHTERFKAMVCHAGVFSYHTQMASDVVRGRERALGAFPWTDISRIDKVSPQRYSKNMKTPTLILHGEKDFRVPVAHGLEYYNTLRQKGVPTRLVYFPDENHWILKPQNSRLWHREVFGWLERYIGTGPTK